jgi:hypothetical protein
MTSSVDGDYAAPAGRICDEGAECLDDSDESYGGNADEVCTAAGCISGGGGGGGDETAPVVDDSCVDSTNVDSWGDGCGWYLNNYSAANCALVSTNGFVPTADCCVCGGGTLEESSDDWWGGDDVTPIIDDWTDGGDGTCTDNDGFDSYGDTCEWYTANTYGCGMYDSGSWSSNDACCSCGGGYTE